MGMDGMFCHVHGDTLGHDNDRRFLEDSQLNLHLANAQADRPLDEQKVGYTDKGFDDDTHIRTAYHGPAPVTPAMHHANGLMTPHRVFEENLFAKVKLR